MNQYGRWSIVHSNDPKVRLLPPPVIVEISPGSFRIGGAVHGSFHVDTTQKGVYVSMSPFSLPMLRETYNVVPLDPERMALFGTGRHQSRYYILERSNHGEGGDGDALVGH